MKKISLENNVLHYITEGEYFWYDLDAFINLDEVNFVENKALAIGTSDSREGEYFLFSIKKLDGNTYQVNHISTINKYLWHTWFGGPATDFIFLDEKTILLYYNIHIYGSEEGGYKTIKLVDDYYIGQPHLKYNFIKSDFLDSVEGKRIFEEARKNQLLARRP